MRREHNRVGRSWRSRLCYMDMYQGGGDPSTNNHLTGIGSAAGRESGGARQYNWRTIRKKNRGLFGVRRRIASCRERRY